MLNLTGDQHRLCERMPRRAFLKVGALADVLRLEAEQPAAPTSRKSVILIFLEGGPSHLDTYDLKPAAPTEYRGEFRPIRSKVEGIDLCELLPRQAQIADKLSIVRSFQVARDLQHALHEVYTGFEGEANQAFPGGAARR